MALTDSILAYYKFDSGALTTDATGNGQTLTNANSVGENASGKIGYAADTGSSNTNKTLYQDSNSPLGLTYDQFATGWSWSGWVNINTNAASKWICLWQVQSGANRRRNCGLMNDNGTLKVVVYDGSASSYTTSHTFSTATWYHIVLTYDGSTLRCYANNSEVLSQSRAMNYSSSSAAGGFGLFADRQSGASDSFLSAIIDEFGAWSKKLTTDEISALYNSGSGLQYPFTTTHIKKFNGVAYANLKKVNGIAIANIKKINGIA